jgi:hypothetical protein
MTISADCLIRMVVAHDVNDVPSLSMNGIEGTSAKEK